MGTLLSNSQIQIVMFLLISFVVIGVIGFREKRQRKEKTLEQRKKQSFNMHQIKFVRDSVDKLNANTNPYKKSKTETLIVQAGYSLSFGDFMFISLVVGGIFFLTFTSTLKNPLLGVIFAFVGYGLPKQLLTIKKNKRLKILERQIGSFMNMFIERFKITGSLKTSLELTVPEFENAEILHKELKTTLVESEMFSTVESLQNLAFRTGNKFLARMIDYYEAAETITATEKIVLMRQAYTQWVEDQSLKRLLKKEIAEPVRDAGLIIGMIPVFAIYQAVIDKSYVDFMLNTMVGKIGTTIIVGTVLVCLWVVVNKINAPLD